MSPDHNSAGQARAGLTLVEMTIAITIMTIMAGAVGALAVSVQQTNDYSYGRSTALQHARVINERINRMATTAYTAAGHPGVAVYVSTLSTYRYPDMLLVWQPLNGVPVNAQGPPLINELVFYSFDPTAPTTLVELTAPSDTRPIPLDSTLQTAAWGATLNDLFRATTSKKTILTKLLRPFTASATQAGFNSSRGAVRFEITVAPTETEYKSYLTGSTNWSSLNWPLGAYSSSYGTRRVWVRTELQLMPAQRAGQTDPTGSVTVPFFFSSALSYLLTP